MMRSGGGGGRKWLALGAAAFCALIYFYLFNYELVTHISQNCLTLTTPSLERAKANHLKRNDEVATTRNQLINNNLEWTREVPFVPMVVKANFSHGFLVPAKNAPLNTTATYETLVWPRRVTDARFPRENYTEKKNLDSGEEVALCLVMAKQTDELLEWVAWHHHVAKIDKMYIGENVDDLEGEATREVNSVLRHYMDAGVVVYEPFLTPKEGFGPGLHQAFVYQHCLDAHGHKHEWIGIIDTDEFVEFNDIDTGANFADVIRPYRSLDKIGSISLFWRVFGNHQQEILSKPRGGSLLNYVWCYPANFYEKTGYKAQRFIKSFVRPAYTYNMSTVHTPTLHSGYKTCDENESCFEPQTYLPYHSSKKVWINHYVSRSVEENRAKVVRGAGDGNRRPINFFDIIDSHATEKCTSARTRMIQSGLRFPRPEPEPLEPFFL